MANTLNGKRCSGHIGGLILYRKLGESIVIDDEIEIQICFLGATQIGLAIQAPRKNKIMRKESIGKPKGAPEH